MEFDDFDEDDEFFSPPPHPDDRLWRHPSEIAAEAAARGGTAGAGAGFGTPGASLDSSGVNTSDRPMLARVAARWPLALAVAGGAVVFATLGMSQLFTVDQAPGIDEIGTTTRTTTSAAASLSASRGEADWDQTLRERVEPTLPTLEVYRGNEAVHGRAIFISDTGHLLTSAQLVADAEMIAVTTADGNRYIADITGADPLTDVAVLKITDGETVHPVATMALDAVVRTGQPALTIRTDRAGLTVAQLTGVGANSTLSDGTISYGLLRVDTPVTSIHAGTAVFDDSGMIIGMVPMIDTSNTVTAAVPIGFAHQVATDLVLGTFDRPWLGVGVSEAANEGSISGSVVQVAEVFPDSPAAEIGLEVGDRITSVAGVEIDSISALLMEIWKFDSSSKIELGVLRQFEYSTKPVVLGERPDFAGDPLLPSS